MPLLTLETMRDELRAEIGASLSPGHNLNQTETHYYVLRRTQRELYKAYDWPNLITEERVAVTAGDQYAGPFTDIDYEQINSIWSSYGSDWCEMEQGFTPADYSVYDPSVDKRGYPIKKYRPRVGTEQIELWPRPSQDTTLIVRGQKKLGDLKDPDDVSTLDGTLIVLFAAADILSDWDRQSASTKAAKATSYMRSIRANLLSDKKKVTKLTPTTLPKLRPYLDYIPET